MKPGMQPAAMRPRSNSAPAKMQVPGARAPAARAPVPSAPRKGGPAGPAPKAASAGAAGPRAPVVNAPVAKAPVAKAPIAKAPVAKAPVAKAPIARAPAPGAAGPRGAPVAGQSGLERLPAEVKGLIGSHLNKTSLTNLKLASKTMAATVNPRPVTRAATTVKNVAQARVNENKGLTRGWKAMMAATQQTATGHPNPATRFAAARQAMEDVIEDEDFVKDLKKETKVMRGVAKKADDLKKKNM